MQGCHLSSEVLTWHKRILLGDESLLNSLKHKDLQHNGWKALEYFLNLSPNFGRGTISRALKICGSIFHKSIHFTLHTKTEQNIDSALKIRKLSQKVVFCKHQVEFRGEVIFSRRRKEKGNQDRLMGLAGTTGKTE